MKAVCSLQTARLDCLLPLPTTTRIRALINCCLGAFYLKTADVQLIFNRFSILKPGLARWAHLSFGQLGNW